MTAIPAIYYSGYDARQLEAELTPTNNKTALRIFGAEVDQTIDIESIQLKHSILQSHFYLYLPDHACCELKAEFYTTLAHFFNQETLFQSWRRYIEKTTSYLLGSLFLSLLLLVLFTQIATPPIAEILADQVPQITRNAMSNEIIQFMDKHFLDPSQLAEKKKQTIQKYFKQITAKYSNNYQFRLLFRQSKNFGANAFALPSGTIVVTDELINSAESDDEIIAILAHEIGHVVLNHSLRQILQDSAYVLVMYLLLGDPTMLTEVLYLAPILIINAHYSRAYEIEADRFGFRLLSQSQWNPLSIIDFYNRHQHKDSDETTTPKGSKISSFFDSHPASKQRIKNIKKWHQQQKKTGRNF